MTYISFPRVVAIILKAFRRSVCLDILRVFGVVMRAEQSFVVSSRGESAPSYADIPALAATEKSWREIFLAHETQIQEEAGQS